MGTSLLERTRELEVLEGALASATGRASDRDTARVVLIAGEAGIGKSSLIHAFTSRIDPAARVLTGGCDDLLTPRTLGPVREAFAGCSPDLDRALADGDRDDLLTGVLAELTDPARRTVLVVEDLHWADDASLDVLSYLARRLTGSTATVIISYRDDEIGPGHPAQRLLGGLSSVASHRLVLSRLSRAAVAVLTGGSDAGADTVHELTAGNPFYVTELLASGAIGPATGGATVPLTVVDAVLARVHQLSAPCRRALEQLAVVPSQAELPLVRALLGDLDVLVEAERRGVLEIRPTTVAFRHELARRAVESSLPAGERMRLNARVLDVLTSQAPEHDVADLPRLVHHAVEAADDATVVELAPAAAARAEQMGSYTQEIRCYRLLLDRERLIDPATSAGVHQQLGWALAMVDELPESLEQSRAAVRAREQLDDAAAHGEALMYLAHSQYLLGYTADAVAASARAVELLCSVAETPVRTSALLNHAVYLQLVGTPDRGAAEDAVASARRIGVPALLARSAFCLGRAQLLLGEPEEGLALMRAGLADARRAGAHFQVLLQHTTLVIELWALARFDECEDLIADGLAYAHEYDMWYSVNVLRAHQLSLQALHGEWDVAIGGLRALLGGRDEPETSSMRHALAPLARLLARRGADEAPAALAWARGFAARSDCYADWRYPSVVEIETAWLAGRPGDAHRAITRLEGFAARPGRETLRGELERWKRRLGLPHELPPGCPELYAAGIRGDWRAAAAAWEALGAPYEQALELADSGDADATRRALTILEDLGAHPAVAEVRRRLHALGATTVVRRGPIAATVANPFGLTDRQLTILEQLGRGLSNAEIAADLVLSVRTVDHHVSAILQKLGVSSRQRAAAVARDRGIER